MTASSCRERHPAPTARRLLLLIGAGVLLVLGGLLLREYLGRGLGDPGLTVLESAIVVAASAEASTQLPESRGTQIVATLDTPIQPGKNVVWCASFLAAWKRIESLAGEPPRALGAEDFCSRLNRAADPSPDLPPETYYVSGWAEQDLIETIQSQMKHQFPDRAPPTFPEVWPTSFVAYAYLQANVVFPVPYLDNPEPREFRDASGEATEVRAFGLPEGESGHHPDIRRQVSVLFYGSPGHFALDLWKDSPSTQVVVASVYPGATLAATLDHVQDSILAARRAGFPRECSANSTLLIPSMVWRLEHRFAELEGKPFTNDSLRHQPISVAFQEVDFALNGTGATVTSEAKLYYKGAPLDYIIEAPFLVYMKKRGAEAPFLVVWLANADLLQTWDN